ncbi:MULTISPECIES: YqiJ family protein [Shewanella]|uniref:YqiJ family protein n=1 Tax=Shewanella TaxID=22 RepID=UPI0006D664A5|nr:MULTISPECIES: YqiJ family protein [Shewanella]KPZ68652.1 Inner membrane protein YqiJ [Shewanella sp. P1-14-1]
MLDFLLINANTPFAIAMTMVLMLALLEGVGLVIGFSISNLIDHLSPVELDVDADLNVANTGLTPLVGWLCLNKLPLLIWLVLLLTCFALIGYSLNFISYQYASNLLSPMISAPIVFVLSLLSTSIIGRPLAKILPKNESHAVSNTSFSGLLAKITVGTARVNSPAEAVLVDQHAQKHYVMVAPEFAEESFNQHDQVVLLNKKNNIWIAAKLDSI